MNKNKFIQGLETALSGNVPPEVVRENLIYYRDYIRAELEKGRTEEDIMDELGDPRLIARTIMDTTPGAEEGAFQPYHFLGFFGEGGSQGSGGGQEESYSQTGRTHSSVHYYNLNKWYWKLLAVVVVILFFMMIVTLISGLVSLVIPLIPLIVVIGFIMWFVGGRRR